MPLSNNENTLCRVFQKLCFGLVCEGNKSSSGVLSSHSQNAKDSFYSASIARICLQPIAYDVALHISILISSFIEFVNSDIDSGFTTSAVLAKV